MAAYEKHQPEAPLNAAYYGQPISPPQPAYYPPPPPPPPRPAPRRGGCARCLLGSLVALVVALGVAVLVLWLIFRPDNLKAYADSAALSRFDLGNGNGAGGDLLQYNLTVVIRVRNPNSFGIRYDYAEAQAFYDGDRFGFDPLQPFYLDSKSDARITASFNSSTVVDDDDARRTYRRENGEGFYYVKVKVYSDLSFRVRIIRRHDFKSKITCVLRLPVPAVGGNVNATAMTTLGTRYGNKRIEPSGEIQFFPSLCITGQEHVHGKDPVFQPNGVLMPPNEHNTGESTRQARITLDSSTEGAAIMCSSSAREDAGASSSSHRKDNMSHPSYGFIPVPIPVGPGMPYHYGAILQPVYYPQDPLMHCDSAGINKAAIQHAPGQSNYQEAPVKPSQVDEHKQSEENHQLHHSRQILRESGEPIDMARAHMDRANQSASCSQDICKGSGCTGSGEADINANTMVALESGNESGIQNCDRSRREAALMKFRMKRKDRCFEKKVRYHSRKKLAEQRPRVKGQFVSQKLKSATTTEAETDS